MKSVKFGLFLLRLLTILVLAMTTAQASATATTAEGAGPAAIVSYDKASDHLRVSVEAVPLKRVLGRTAQQSGIEVMFDDMADEPITVDIEASSLAEGLKKILKGRNYMLRYSRDEKQNLMLIGVMVLPVGEQDTGRAKRVVAMDDEAFYRARSQLSIEQAQAIDMSLERWQARLSEMPPQLRQQLEKETAERMQQQLVNDRLRAERIKKHRQTVAKLKENRQKKRELALQGMDPEQRAAFEQDGEAAREEMKKLLKIK